MYYRVHDIWYTPKSCPHIHNDVPWERGPKYRGTHCSSGRNGRESRVMITTLLDRKHGQRVLTVVIGVVNGTRRCVFSMKSSRTCAVNEPIWLSNIYIRVQYRIYIHSYILPLLLKWNIPLKILKIKSQY